ncbi:MAG: ABC transporter permease [Oscillospiraceae bacterium]|jgi:peptide/nickel transport system permease protein|nr:ABC transporter permease [Oscillospiraceae bacterium]
MSKQAILRRALPGAGAALPRQSESAFILVWRDPLGRAGLCGVALIALMAICAPVIARYGVAEMHPKAKLTAPGLTFFFGSDNFGRDVFSRIVYGARVSLIVGIVSVGIAAGLGYLLGILAGFFEGKCESIIMMAMDIIFAFPSILLALFIVSALGPNIINTMIAIGIVNVPVFTRTVRASVKSVKSMDYIKNAISIGLTPRGVLLRHVTPNVLAPFTVQATLALSGAILTEASMSFLGLGIQPPQPSWGSMLSDARKYMEIAPWLVIFPALFIILTILSFNVLGDSLRDVLDPKLKL